MFIGFPLPAPSATAWKSQLFGYDPSLGAQPSWPDLSSESQSCRGFRFPFFPFLPSPWVSPIFPSLPSPFLLSFTRSPSPCFPYVPPTAISVTDAYAVLVNPSCTRDPTFFWRSGPQVLHPIPSEVSLYLERGQIRHHPFFKAPYTILECS